MKRHLMRPWIRWNENVMITGGLHLIDDRAACLAHSHKIFAYNNDLKFPPKDLALAATIFNSYPQ
jgi:hypothetical protein